MKYWLTIMLVLQIFGLHAETIEVFAEPVETCELKFEKDIFSSEEKSLITKDIQRMFFLFTKRADIIKKNIFTGKYSFAKVPPEAFPKNFTKYFDFEEGKTNFVFILNSKGCDAYKKAFDFRYKHKEEIKKLEEFHKALHNNELVKLPREEKERMLFGETKGINDFVLDNSLHHEYFDYFLDSPLGMLDTRYVTYPDGNTYLTWYFGVITNEWGEFDVYLSAHVYRDGIWSVLSGRKIREFLVEEYKQWVLSDEE